MIEESIERETNNASVNALVASAQAGDSYAFALLANKYHRFLSKYVYSLGVPSSEREDLIQEGMIGLLKAVRTYDGVTSAFSTYAGFCIKTSVITALRKYHRTAFPSSAECQPEAEVVDETALSPEFEIIDRESTKQLHDRFFSVLSKFESEVFEMYLAEVPYTVIAFKLNRDEKSIDNALQRIKNKLKKLV